MMNNCVNNLNKSIRVGHKVCAGTYTGVVRYVGPLPDTESIWGGIEWDDLSRGKHDGTHNGIRYFKAQ